MARARGQLPHSPSCAAHVHVSKLIVHALALDTLRSTMRHTMAVKIAVASAFGRLDTKHTPANFAHANEFVTHDQCDARRLYVPSCTALPPFGRYHIYCLVINGGRYQDHHVTA